MCKVTKETAGANKIMINAIDLTSITFRWTLSSYRQSVFSTTLDAKKMAAGRGVFIWSKLGQNLLEMTAELLL